MPQNPTKPNHIYLIYMYKEDLAFNNLQWLICHKIKPNQLSHLTVRAGIYPPPILKFQIY